ncbi:MAG TPA: flagellar motor switch protein FliM [Candidatus Baltobacteraceae bacterium]|nr:flagellar motor switch protein FliM [Candidatus Baltobacteraceae bacterium]
MSEILTQEEIDSLLNAVTSGKVASGGEVASRRHQSVLPYDFRRPNRIAREQVRTLQILHEGFARNLSTSLSAYLRSVLDVQLTSVEQVSYGEFLQAVGAPAALGIFEMAPLKGGAVLDINPTLIFPMIDRILGGPGRAAAQVRELTEIERALATRIFRKVLTDLQHAWTQLGRYELRLLNVETNPQFVQLTSPNDNVILVTFDMHVGEAGGVLNLCLPFATIEPVLPKLMTQRWFGTPLPTREGTAVSKDVETHLRDTRLDLRAVLEPLCIPIGNLTQLKIGDVLPLPWETDLRVVVEVGGAPRFVGRAGRKQRKRAVEIVSALKGGGSHA